jgi:hypothetical protein
LIGDGIITYPSAALAPGARGAAILEALHRMEHLVAEHQQLEA